MSPSTITILFLLFAIVMFVMEKIPLGVTSMIVCIGLIVTGVLDAKTAFARDFAFKIKSSPFCKGSIWQNGEFSY